MGNRSTPYCRLMDCDVAVVGLGAMGAHALWRLACRPGVRVIGIEQYQPGHDRGASHGQSRIFRTAYMEGESYVPLMQAARRLWDALAAETGAGLLVRTGCLTIGAADSPAVAGAAGSARRHGLGYELLDPSALRARFPQHAGVRPGEIGLYEPEAGVLRPELAVRSAVAAATARGAQVLTGARVRAIHPDGDAIRIDLTDPAAASDPAGTAEAAGTAEGARASDLGRSAGGAGGSGGERVVTARQVVVAAGRWVGGLLTGLAPRLRVVRRVQAWFSAAEPAAFGPDRFPVFLRESAGTVWYGLSSMDDRTVKVAVHFGPETDEQVDPATGPRAPDRADADLIGTIVARTLPGLDPDPVRMVPCTYTLTPDEHFLVGTYAPGLTVLGGFSGHGFKFAPLIGEVAADLALTGRTDAPIGLFEPHRFDYIL
jgi:sarcosine oxidase